MSWTKLKIHQSISQSLESWVFTVLVITKEREYSWREYIELTAPYHEYIRREIDHSWVRLDQNRSFRFIGTSVTWASSSTTSRTGSSSWAVFVLNGRTPRNNTSDRTLNHGNPLLSIDLWLPDFPHDAATGGYRPTQHCIWDRLARRLGMRLPMQISVASDPIKSWKRQSSSSVKGSSKVAYK